MPPLAATAFDAAARQPPPSRYDDAFHASAVPQRDAARFFARSAALPGRRRRVALPFFAAFFFAKAFPPPLPGNSFGTADCFAARRLVTAMIRRFFFFFAFTTPAERTAAPSDHSQPPFLLHGASQPAPRRRLPESPVLRLRRVERSAFQR